MSDWINPILFFIVICLAGGIFQRMEWILSRIEKAQDDIDTIKRRLPAQQEDRPPHG